ncbi:hypothetical protein IP81_16760, partial [Novosphingobium sp. AAP83]|uniref:beta strand repeat-containing protein n=1 Tax=Novosphingobium sp. AAP83 TaxID=1523425 RepID=UPI0006CDABB0
QALADLDTDPSDFNSALTGAAEAADITAIETSNGSGTIDGSAITAINGTATAVVQALADLDTDPSDFNSALTNTTLFAAELNTLDGNTTGTINVSSVISLTGSAIELAATYSSNGVSGLGDEAVTLTGTSAAASDINAIIFDNTVTVNASSVTTLAGSASDIATSYASDRITDLGNEAVTLTDTILAATELNALDGETTGVIDASSVARLVGSAENLASSFASVEIAGLSGVAVTLTDTMLAATALNVLDTKTTGVIDASSVAALTGSGADVAISYASNQISGLGSAAVTLSDTTLAATALNALDTKTTGTIDASSIAALTGSVADLATSYASLEITGLGGRALTISDTTAAASDLNVIDAGTTGTLDASSVLTLTGTAADVATSYAAAGIIGLGREAVTLSGTTVAATDLNAIDEETIGVIDASSVTRLTGSAADVARSYASVGITGLGNEAVTLSGTTAAASDLNAINAATIITVNASTVTTLTGSAADVAASYASSGVVGLANEAVTLNDSTLAATALNGLDGVTTGTIDASSVATLTGTASAVAVSFASAGITGLGGSSVTLSDTTLAASTLIALDANTTGVIDASAVLTLTGSEQELAQAYASSGITGLGSASSGFSGTTAAASALIALDLSSAGAVDASTVTTLTGSAADVAAVYASLGITGLGNEGVTLSGTTATATQLNAIDFGTTGTINMGEILTVSGSVADLTTMYSATAFTGRGDEALTLTDTSVAASSLNSLDTATTGAINATTVLTLTGTATELATAYASGG